jgi:hypothetical protein
MTIEIIRRPITRAQLSSLAEAQFGDMVKAVVDDGQRPSFPREPITTC